MSKYVAGNILPLFPLVALVYKPPIVVAAHAVVPRALKASPQVCWQQGQTLPALWGHQVCHKETSFTQTWGNKNQVPINWKQWMYSSTMHASQMLRSIFPIILKSIEVEDPNPDMHQSAQVQKYLARDSWLLMASSKPGSSYALRPCDAYMRQYTKPSLVQIMAWHLFGAKPLSEPTLVYC